MNFSKYDLDVYRYKSRRRLSLTTLIDVIFLLLLFFMLSTTFTRFGEIVIFEQGASTSENSATNNLQGKPDIVLQVGQDQWRLNGKAVQQSEAVDILELQYEKGARSILLLMRSDASTQDLVSAMDLLSAKTRFQVSVSY